MINCISDTLYAKIRVKRSLVPGEQPSNGSLELGEIAINIPDKKIYVGNENKNPVLLNFGSGNGGGGIYSAGSGITISVNNEISFNQFTLPNKYIEFIKIKPPTNTAGYVYYNGNVWSITTPPTGLTLNALFSCIGGVINNQYYIDGGKASGSIWCSNS